jgi:hypothetical protein
MIRKTWLAIGLSGLLLGCASFRSQTYETKSQEKPGHAPVIVDYYAPEVMRPGSTWKIFLRAEDKDANMKYISAELWQAGVGDYSTDLSWIKDGDRGELEGYLTMYIPPDQTLIWDQFELRLLIRDSQGKRSEYVKLPLRIDFAQPETVPQKWETAANHPLGTIMVDIQSSQRYNSGDDHGHRLWLWR